MKEINAYLIFNGNCREAMTFYQKCLGGDLRVITFADMPGNIPPEAKDQIAHARITKGGSPILMASDNMGGPPVEHGGNFFVSIPCDSAQETEKLFAALSEKGKPRCRRRKPHGQSVLLCSLTSLASTGC